MTLFRIYLYYLLCNTVLTFRNRAKGHSLSTKSFVSLMLKTIFACISRVLIFSAWLYVANDGEFSSMKTLFGYYLTVLVLVVFHFFLNKIGPSCSSSYWIGLTQHKNDSQLNFKFDFFRNTVGRNEFSVKLQ